MIYNLSTNPHFTYCMQQIKLLNFKHRKVQKERRSHSERKEPAPHDPERRRKKKWIDGFSLKQR